MTIADLNRRWRPPAVLAVWVAAFVLLWVDLDWLHRAAAATLGGAVLLSLLDARRETWMVVGLIAVLGGALVGFGADPGEVLHGLDLRDSAISGFDLSLLISAHAAFKAANLSFFTSPDFMDKLSGTNKLRLAIEAGLSVEQIRGQWQPQLDEFKQLRQRYLLYPD